MKAPTRGMKGRVWRIVVTGGGVSADEIASELTPGFELGEWGGKARLTAEDFRLRQASRVAYGLAAGFFAWRLRGAVGRALARLTRV